MYNNNGNQCYAVATMHALRSVANHLFKKYTDNNDIEFWMKEANVSNSQKKINRTYVTGETNNITEFLSDILETSSDLRNAFAIKQREYRSCGCEHRPGQAIDTTMSARTPDSAYRGIRDINSVQQVCKNCNCYITENVITEKISDYYIVDHRAGDQYQIEDHFTLETSEGTHTWAAAAWLCRFGDNAGGHYVAYYRKNNQLLENNDGREHVVPYIHPRAYIEMIIYKKI